MVKIERVKDITKTDEYPGSLKMAIGGFSSTEAERLKEEVTGSVPEGVSRPRTAIGYKDGYAYLYVTDYRRDMSLNGFGLKMDDMGFRRDQWMFLDGGGSTQCYLYNKGKVLARNSSRKVPMLIKVERGKYEAWKYDGLIVCKVKPEHMSFYHKTTTTKDEPGFDGFNATFFGGGYELLGVAYEDGKLHANGVPWRPARACMMICGGPDKPETVEERLADLEARVEALEKK
jgi:hypothetical protein